ncbi:c-type cytochrome [Novosphingobium resinovorum]|uniref:c-type cytochrome n=1 Tax=Novosphingobium resinovorum TaxID=158500 RepID=UPI002ED626CD|nr:c-type cytochrome [Novosphingobium resinovorum]
MMVRITIGRIVLVLCALVTLVLGVAAAGLVPIAASSGHWKITDWFLHWTMQNSARTYSAVQTPKQVRDDNGLISAAGHFRQACQSCHGAPGEAPSPVMQAATPPAPDLAKTAGHYTDRELFWIIRHGVKFTGMPAWAGTNRNDEIRRMVAFVRRLPTMTPQQYRALTQPITSAPLPQCAGCHGVDGKGRAQPDIPILAGQDAAYMLRALKAYKSGKRASAVMQTAAASLDEAQMNAAANYYARLPGLSHGPATDLRAIAAKGLPEAQLPACAQCHAPGKTAPVITGQRAIYLAERLRQWRGEDTVIDAHKPQDPMAVIARRIPEEALDDLAENLATPTSQTATGTTMP